MGVPLALHVLSGDAGERVVYGDSRGAAVLLLCGSRELPARDLISTETHKVCWDRRRFEGHGQFRQHRPKLAGS